MLESYRAGHFGKDSLWCVVKEIIHIKQSKEEEFQEETTIRSEGYFKTRV